LRTIHLVTVAALLLLPFGAWAADTSTTTVSGVSDLASLLEGEFTTTPAAMQREAGAPPPGRTYYELAKRVEVPALGSDVVYSELREGGPDGKIVRQRLYALKPDKDGGEITMKSYSFTNNADLAGAQAINTPLAKLHPSDLKEQPANCSIEWRKTDLGFEARVLAGSCNAAPAQSSPDTPMMAVSKTNLTLPVEGDLAARPTLFRRLR